MTSFVLRARGRAPQVLYYLTPLPLAIVLLTNAVYGCISIAWGFQGRRPLDVENVYEPSPGWPPFLVPQPVWGILALVASAAAIDLVCRRPGSWLSARPGLIAFVYGADAVHSATYGRQFQEGSTWLWSVYGAAGAMALTSLIATVVFANRLAREAALALRRRGRAR